MNLDIQCFEDLISEAKNINFGVCKERPHLMPTIFGKNWSENFMSDWLAFILNPAVNSLGVGPLNLLLEISGYGENKFSDEATTDMGPSGEYSRCRERYLDEERHRRIDLLFKVEDKGATYLVTIENKIYAGQSGDDQLKRYGELIDKIIKGDNKEYRAYKGCEPVKIYFTLAKSEAEAEKADFKSASHREFITRLKETPLDFVGHLRESFIISEYIKNMEEYIMPDKTTAEFTEKEAVFFVENYGLINRISERKNAFTTYLRGRVYKEASECFADDSYERSSTSDSSDYCFWFSKNLPFQEKDRWAFHFEIYCKNLIDDAGSVHINLEIHNEIKSNKEMRQTINQKIGKGEIGDSKKICTKTCDSSLVKTLSDIEEFIKGVRSDIEEFKKLYDGYVAVLREEKENTYEPSN